MKKRKKQSKNAIKISRMKNRMVTKAKRFVHDTSFVLIGVAIGVTLFVLLK